MDTTIFKLSQYKNAIEINDFIDFLYSHKIIDEPNYFSVWARPATDRLHELFRILDTKKDLEKVFKYLKDTYPNNEKLYEDERNFHIISVRGGFPKLPPNYVSRSSLVSDVRHKLMNLPWGRKIVVHGMMGYGKSCLVNEVLSDSTVRQYFNNCLFWINLGDCHTDQNILQPMWRLYTAATSYAETKTISCLDVQILKDLLKNLFLHDRLNNSLIILDDACSEEVLTYFDIGCKAIITTQNKNILRNEDAIFVEVRTGFSRTESLELFRKSLDNQNLPTAAEEIHNICQGHPMLIALIGSYLQENAEEVRNKKNEIWQFVKNMLLRGNYRLNEYNTEIDIPQMIKKCIEKLLTTSLKDLYHDLAIFQQDVNIPPKVLEILWDKNQFEVRNTMNKFAEKSLIVPFYHNDLKTYIYGIHDIHLNYLKEITKERTVSLHRKLISGYDHITKGNYADLPNDNYTFQFIGYHLLHAEVFNKFSIYFDFKFLENKLRAVGKEDVLRDFEKYGIYITKQDHVLMEKLNQYKEFIDRCGGNLYNFEKTDIIQYALREKKDSLVFKDALALAKESPRLYFQLQKPVEGLDYSNTINIKEDITAACFVDSPQHILIGTTNGRVKLFYEQTEKEISSFIGHTGAIKVLLICPGEDKRYFLSVANDGLVFLWRFAADSSRNSRDFGYQATLSPKTKQSFWQDIHTPDRGQIQPKNIFKASDVDDCLIAAAFCSKFPDTFQIATGSRRGNVAIWNAQTGERLYNTGHRGLETPCVLFSEGMSPLDILFTCEDGILAFELRDNKLHYYTQLHNRDICNSLFITDDKVLIAVSEKHIRLWYNNKNIDTFALSEGDKKNICSTLTDDQEYLIVSTNKGTVYIWNVEERELVREFRNEGLAKSLDTFYDEDKSVHILLISNDRKTIQQCHIQPYDKEPQAKDVPMFTPLWKRKNALTALVSPDNQIQVFSGYLQISETEILKSQVTCTCFSVCGSCVVYGLNNGEIHLFHIKSKTSSFLDNEKKEPITYLKCFDPTDSFRSSTMSSCGSNDSLDLKDQNASTIVAATKNRVIIYNDKKKYVRIISDPRIFYKLNRLILVDSHSHVYSWNIYDNSFSQFSNRHLIESVDVILAACSFYKLTLAVCYEQGQYNFHFIDLYHVIDDSNSLDLIQRIQLSEKAISLCLSSDGTLMAVGFETGEIKVWKVSKHQPISLLLHNNPVQGLLFSPNLEPILVSFGEEIAWWNLKKFQRSSPKKRGRPNSINILNGDLNNMDISFWTERQPLKDTEFLLSCIKLHGEAKYLSASPDFNSFLTIDDNGKVYIMEIVHPDT